jgi:hypothetical protein
MLVGITLTETFIPFTSASGMGLYVLGMTPYVGAMPSGVVTESVNLGIMLELHDILDLDLDNLQCLRDRW